MDKWIVQEDQVMGMDMGMDGHGIPVVQLEC